MDLASERKVKVRWGGVKVALWELCRGAVGYYLDRSGGAGTLSENRTGLKIGIMKGVQSCRRPDSVGGSSHKTLFHIACAEGGRMLPYRTKLMDTMVGRTCRSAGSRPRKDRWGRTGVMWVGSSGLGGSVRGAAVETRILPSRG